MNKKNWQILEITHSIITGPCAIDGTLYSSMFQGMTIRSFSIPALLFSDSLQSFRGNPENEMYI